MPQPLRILQVEDNPDDAQLTMREIKRAGFEVISRRVDTEPAFLAGLAEGWDIVVSDFAMPEFDGMRALDLLTKSGLDVPFILVSGTIGEDLAVEAMKRGATDYLLKDRVARLGPAIKRALQEKALLRARKKAEEELFTTHAQLRQMLDNSPAVIYALKVEGQRVVPHLVSENINQLLGFTVAESLSYEWWLTQLHESDRERAVAGIAETLSRGASVTEYRIRHKNGSYRWVEDQRRVVRDSANQPMELTGVWTDITERKRAEEVLRGVSTQEGVSRKKRVLRDAIVVVGLSALVFALGYRFDLFLPAFQMLSDQKKHPMADESFGTLAFLNLALLVFSYRRWKESVGEALSQQHVAESLRILHEELDQKVQRRTAELAKTNAALQSEVAERRRTEEALRASETRLNFALQTSQTGAWELSLRDHTAKRTAIHDHIFGYSTMLPQWTYEMFLEHVLPEDRAEVERSFRDAVTTRATWNFECRIRRPDSEVRWIWAAGGHELDSMNNVVRMSGIVQDITARKRVEEETKAQLRELQRWHEAMLGREDRVLELKREVNELLAQLRQPARYAEFPDPMKAPLPPNETQRLETLRQYEVLDTPAEQAFDDLASLAAHICQTPMALVSLVDESRQWFKSKIGVSAAETSRDIAFCAHTILHKDEVLEVRDAEADPRFAGSPLVTADPHVRFYAGAPLVAPGGQALGALCVMDRAPRALSAEQVAALRALSRNVIAQLELGRRTRDLAKEAAERERANARLRQQFDQLSASKDEADRLLGLAQKSRHALLSVLEDEKQAGQNLRESEERFRQLTENIHEVFWMTDCHKREMLYVSPAYERIWGRTCASLYVSPGTWLEAIHFEDRERVQHAAASKQARGDYDEEYRIVRPDKTVRWIHDRAFPIRNPSGEVYRVVGTAEDITERKKLEAQFRQAQKMEGIGQLAGGVAHDFNNILMIIQVNLEMVLMDEMNLRLDNKERLREIASAADRAAGLTRQLLTFSRSEAMQVQLLDLSDLTASFTKMLRRIVGENIRVKNDFAPTAPSIMADPGMIEQVLMNLAVNARDAMPNGGQLAIGTEVVTVDQARADLDPRRYPGQFACLSVRDTGTGIAPENMSRIFEPFFTTKGVGKGTGLGLATVFGIAEQHKGWVEVSSEVGVGTVFRVFLPMSPTDAAAADLAVPQKVPGGSEKVLVVEDESGVRHVLLQILENYGYTAMGADSGVAALKIWADTGGQFDLLITDMVMPGGLTGLELIERLRAQKAGLKVVLISGYSAELARRDVTRNRDIVLLHKPFSTRLLAETVRKCLDAV